MNLLQISLIYSNTKILVNFQYNKLIKSHIDIYNDDLKRLMQPKTLIQKYYVLQTNGYIFYHVILVFLYVLNKYSFHLILKYSSI